MMAINIFGKDSRLHHIGIVVRSVKKELENLGKTSKIFTDKIQKVKVTFLNINGAPVELIEPLGSQSPVRENLKKNQPLAHLCIEVKSIEKSLAKGRKFFFHPISSPVPAAAFRKRKIVWLYHSSFGLIELVEKTK